MGTSAAAQQALERCAPNRGCGNANSDDDRVDCALIGFCTQDNPLNCPAGQQPFGRCDDTAGKCFPANAQAGLNGGSKNHQDFGSY